MLLKFKLILVLLLLTATFSIQARTIGEVSTVFRAFSANDKIVIETFTDPDVPSIHCYLSRAKAGGVTGAIGLAEDSSEAAISCIKTKPIQVSEKIISEEGKDVFKKSTSIAFKTIQVVRFYDKQNKVLVYLAYSDKLIEGSPNNAVSVVSLN